MTKLQLAVFDMAGTTVRDQQEVESCFLKAAGGTGLETTAAALQPMMGWSKRRVFETLWQQQLTAANKPSEQPQLDALVDKSYQVFRTVLETHYQTQPVHPTVGCLELFDWLQKRGIAIALNTGFYRKVTDIILQRLGWQAGLNADYVGTAESRIQVSVTPSEIHNNEGRPAPYLIQKAMYKLGIKDPQRVLVVGDTPADLQAGINAHCWRSVAVTNGTHTDEQLQPHPNHGLFESLSALQAELSEQITH